MNRELSKDKNPDADPPSPEFSFPESEVCVFCGGEFCRSTYVLITERSLPVGRECWKKLSDSDVEWGEGNAEEESHRRSLQRFA